MIFILLQNFMQKKILPEVFSVRCTNRFSLPRHELLPLMRTECSVTVKGLYGNVFPLRQGTDGPRKSADYS